MEGSLRQDKAAVAAIAVRRPSAQWRMDLKCSDADSAWIASRTLEPAHGEQDPFGHLFPCFARDATRVARGRPLSLRVASCGLDVRFVIAFATSLPQVRAFCCQAGCLLGRFVFGWAAGQSSGGV